MKINRITKCPCGSGLQFKACCRPLSMSEIKYKFKALEISQKEVAEYLQINKVSVSEHLNGKHKSKAFHAAVGLLLMIKTREARE